jgi:integrase
MSRPISEKIVTELSAPERGNRRHYFSGSTLQGKRAPSGFNVTVTAKNCKSFCWFHRVDGRPHNETLGRWIGNDKGGSLSVFNAIVLASRRAAEVAMGGANVDARPARTRRLEDRSKPEGTTVGDMLDEFVQRYVRQDRKLRTADVIESNINRLIKPAIGGIGIYELRRRHVVAMLDAIADKNGQAMADMMLSHLSKACAWYATRDDDFRSPIVRGMKRTRQKEQARSRVLSDGELRRVWTAASEAEGPFPALVKFLLLTAARRTEAAAMTWAELEDGANNWRLPAARNKTAVDLVRPLSKAALELLEKQERLGPYVFTTDGRVKFTNFSRPKTAFDKACGVTGWRLHDLRRTARSLMARAGVSREHAERCLGHTIVGVEGTYNRHTYEAEMAAAYEALAALIERIVNPPAGNVVQLARGE